MNYAAQEVGFEVAVWAKALCHDLHGHPACSNNAPFGNLMGHGQASFQQGHRHVGGAFLGHVSMRWAGRPVCNDTCTTTSHVRPRHLRCGFCRCTSPRGETRGASLLLFPLVHCHMDCAKGALAYFLLQIIAYIKVMGVTAEVMALIEVACRCHCVWSEGRAKTPSHRKSRWAPADCLCLGAEVAAAWEAGDL